MPRIMPPIDRYSNMEQHAHHELCEISGRLLDDINAMTSDSRDLMGLVYESVGQIHRDVDAENEFKITRHLPYLYQSEKVTDDILKLRNRLIVINDACKGETGSFHPYGPR